MSESSATVSMWRSHHRITNILNCNNISIANDLLSHLANKHKCTVAKLGVTVSALLAAKPSNAATLLTTLRDSISTMTARATIKAPVDISDVANYATVDIQLQKGIANPQARWPNLRYGHRERQLSEHPKDIFSIKRDVANPFTGNDLGVIELDLPATGTHIHKAEYCCTYIAAGGRW
ncbi:hypothetical protein FIBSPDRAFT_1041161 [Athelia psychrophila]|uniref:Uncharacterized protein n=1 Tax=Athelia psychrophila TaxID=1759441 RepID=A0A166P7B0_9AGAM|nr:hypothetical protein FIBSPDRAFT_1041161 [Fibularhizoctonia sp. CBS 109695]